MARTARLFKYIDFRESKPWRDRITLLRWRPYMPEAHRLLHGGELRVWGDAGYQGVHKREENRELVLDWQVAMRPGRRRQLDPRSAEALAERGKASVRAKVEHPFLYLKRRFGYAKVRYRGLAKNTQRLALLLGLANLMIVEGYRAA